MNRFTLAIALLAFSPAAMAEGGQPGAHFIQNWDQDSDGIVTLEEIKARRNDVFYAFDENENDILSPDEYAVFDQARDNDMAENAGHGNSMRRASVGMTLDFNDTDKNGEVSRAEFLAHASDWMAMIDRDADGVVTPRDFGRQ